VCLGNVFFCIFFTESFDGSADANADFVGTICRFHIQCDKNRDIAIERLDIVSSKCRLKRLVKAGRIPGGEQLLRICGGGFYPGDFFCWRNINRKRSVGRE